MQRSQSWLTEQLPLAQAAPLPHPGRQTGPEGSQYSPSGHDPHALPASCDASLASPSADASRTDPPEPPLDTPPVASTPPVPEFPPVLAPPVPPLDSPAPPFDAPPETTVPPFPLVPPELRRPPVLRAPPVLRPPVSGAPETPMSPPVLGGEPASAESPCGPNVQAPTSAAPSVDSRITPPRSVVITNPRLCARAPSYSALGWVAGALWSFPS